MKQNVHAYAYLHQRMEGDLGPVFSMFVISLVCHFAFFAVVVLAPKHKSSKRFEPRIINVNLVALPRPKASSGPKPVAKPAKKVKLESKTPTPIRAEKKVLIKETVTPAPRPKPEISIAPKPKPVKVKTSLKKKTYKPQTVVKPAIKRIEKKVKKSQEKSQKKSQEKSQENSKKNRIAEALNRLQDKVAQAEKERRSKARE